MTLWFDRISYEANQDGGLTPTYWGIGRELPGEPRSCVGVSSQPTPLWFNWEPFGATSRFQYGCISDFGIDCSFIPKVFFWAVRDFFPAQIFRNLECRVWWNLWASSETPFLWSENSSVAPRKKMCFFACALGLASKLFTKGNEYNFASFLLMVKCSKAQPNAVREAGPNFGLFRI